MGRLSLVPNSSLSALLLGALTVMFGLQLMRDLLVELAFYLSQAQGVSPVAVGVISLAVFLCGFAEPAVRRVLGPRKALLVVVGGLAAVRVGEQIASSLPVDLGLSIVGTVLFLWSLPLLFRSLRVARADSAIHSTIALLLGISADTALKGVFGTLDLSWVEGIEADSVVLVLVALHGLLLWNLHSDRVDEPRSESAGCGPSYMAFGPALVLEMLLFQNVAHQTAVIGWPQPAVYGLVTVGNLGAVAVAVELARRERPMPWSIAAVLGALLIAIVSVDHSGMLAAVMVLGGQVAVAAGLVSIVKGCEGRTDVSSTGGGTTWVGVGMILFLALLFIYYGSYDTNLVVPKEGVRPLAAFLVGMAMLIAVHPRRASTTSVTRAAGVPALLLLVLPLIYLANWKEFEPPDRNGFPIRVMSYNLHQGFDVHGRLGMEALAEVIEGEEPDIVALQEVSRGWVVNGSVDMLAWLSQRLDMDYVWGPAADPVWGNAILSRFPITEYENHEMPNNDHIHFNRAFLTATVDIGGGEVLYVVATHLHAGGGDSAIRLPQVRAMLEAVDSSRTTVLLGDLNAHPDDPEMLLIAGSGLIDTFTASRAAGDGFTSPSYGPWERIDYIWSSPDLSAREFSIPRSLASDHLAVAVTLYR